jgi:hypothetical protein
VKALLDLDAAALPATALGDRDEHPIALGDEVLRIGLELLEGLEPLLEAHGEFVVAVDRSD